MSEALDGEQALERCYRSAPDLVISDYSMPGFNGIAALTTVRAIAPTVPAVLAVLAVRALEGAPRSLGVAIAELALYVAVTVAATWLLERDLLREATNYLRRQGAQSPAAT